MLRFFSNLVLLYPKIGALVAQECGVPGAQAAQAMFGTPEPRLVPSSKSSRCLRLPNGLRSPVCQTANSAQAESCKHEEEATQKSSLICGHYGTTIITIPTQLAPP